jgi:hypothetical protein
VATIVTRAGKGAALTHQEVDANFTGLNTELGQKEVASNKGVANGYASLDAAGKVPSAQLPSYVDDVVEVANFASLPGTGETGKIYVTIDANKTYRWTGSTYIEISASPGSTDSLAEGSTNLYFTQARARASISASGSLSYNSSTGVMSFTDAVTSVAGRTGAVTLTSSDVGLGNVENKSSATIRGEITSGNVTTALGYTPANSTSLSSYLPLSGGTITGNIVAANTGVGAVFGNLWVGYSGYYNTLQTSSASDTLWLQYSHAGPVTLGYGGGSVTVGPSQHAVIHAGNYNSYAMAGAGYSANQNLNTSSTPTFGTLYLTTDLQLTRSDTSPALLFTSQNQWRWIYTGGGNYWQTNLSIVSGGGNIAIHGNAALHAGNYNSYALPLSGGTLSGAITASSGASRFGNIQVGAGTWKNTIQPIDDTNMNLSTPSGSVYVVNNLYVGGNQSIHAGNYTSYSPSLTGSGASGTWGISITGSAESVGWANITAGTRTGHGDLRFQPPASSYAGIQFLDSGGSGAGWFLIRGTSDTDVYTAEGITLVADKGWLTLAQRDTAGKGVRIMSGTTSTERIKVTTAGDIQLVNGNSFSYNGNAVLHAGNYSSYALPLSGGTVTGFLGATGGSKITVQNQVDGGTSRGIMLWSDTDSNWGIYMAQSGAGRSLSGGTAPASIDGRTAHAVRFRAYGSDAIRAFIWENDLNQCVASLSPDSGNFYTRGQIYATTSQNLVLNTGNYSGYSTFTGLVSSSGNNGFANATYYVGARNPIWSFGNASTYGISYYQGSAGVGGTDTISLHPNGNTTASGAAFSASGVNSYVLGNIVLHAGNYSSYALPLSGGDMTGRIRMGTFAQSQNNTGEAWIGRAADRSTGTMTVQLGNSADRTFEVVDNAWSIVIFNAGINSFNYKNNAILHAGNYSSYAPTLTGGGASGTWGISISGTAANSSAVNGRSVHQIFNNMGQNHSAYTDFNSVPDFGAYYVQGTGNGPGTGAGQFYGFTLGLGNDYAYSSYACQIAIPRYAYNGSGDRYLSIRNRERGTWGGWSKINAGYADSAGSAGSASSATTAGSVSGLTLNSSSAPINPDNVTQNQIGYNTSVSLFGQSDGGLYSSAYSSAWIHQIYGDFRTGQIAIRGKNSGSWQSWRAVLDASNYTSYTGGLSSTNNWSGQNYFVANRNTTSDSPALQAYSSNASGAIMSFHRGGYYAVNFGLDSDNVMRIGGWSASANRWQLDMSGNGTYAGNVTAYSDERLKKDWSPIYDGFVDRLAVIRAGTYTRIDSGERQAGVSAQAMRELLPEVVSEDNEGTLALAYGNAAMVSAVELAKELVALRNKFAALEARIH